jgi:hypothetical protein
MADLSLRKLPDRKPVKLAITLPPDLHQRLQDYAAAYAEAYGANEPVTGLVPAILAQFLDADRAFSRRQKA